MADFIEIGAGNLTIAEVWRLACGKAGARLSDAALARVRRSAAHVEAALARDGEIYGVTTGYGDSCTTTVPAELTAELPLHLSRFHGCGMGRMLTPEETRAVVAVRLAALDAWVRAFPNDPGLPARLRDLASDRHRGVRAAALQKLGALHRAEDLAFLKAYADAEPDPNLAVAARGAAEAIEAFVKH